MGDKSRIEWTDATWNPVTGCTKVSAGCKNCYAERVAERFWGHREFTNIQTHPERLTQPLGWTRPRMIFVNSMSDLFHPDVPLSFIDEVRYIIKATPQHTYQILTKRPLALITTFDSWTDNVWVGVSVENQETADDRIPALADVMCGVRFVSCEPLLGPIDLGAVTPAMRLGWVIVGGESGPKARPMDPGWARSIRDQCSDTGTPFFMKQMAKKTPIPDDLRIRKYPAQARRA